MSLPELIEIVPPQEPVQAEITVPGSKSITNRALLLAALAEGETSLPGSLWSEDTQVMVDCLREIGFMVDVQPDPKETSNRVLTVYGRGGLVPPGGTEEQPLDLFVGNAGTAARFLTAFLCLGRGVYRLHGVERMHERPQAALLQALRELGYRIDSANDKLPASIHGAGPRAGRCRVSIAESSQFASALLLCAGKGQWEVQVVDENAEESPYVAMTAKMIQAFPRPGGKFPVEPDASSGSYFIAAAQLLKCSRESRPQSGFEAGTAQPQPIRVAHWPNSGWQMDEAFPKVLRRWTAGTAQELRPEGSSGALARETLEISRTRDLGDSIMTAIVLAPLATRSVRFTDLGRLRLQECERVAALRTELTKCGANIVERGDMLEVFPSQLQGAEIETYNDHRMAMCFAILGLKVPAIRINNPACVKKTFPNFFQKLAAPPPHGLGVEIREARSGRGLTHDELSAD